VRFFHFPLRTHRVRLTARVTGRSASMARPRQLSLVRDEDVVALEAHQNALAGRRKAPAPQREVIDLSRW
jgi:hypothetical protein